LPFKNTLWRAVTTQNKKNKTRLVRFLEVTMKPFKKKFIYRSLSGEAITYKKKKKRNV
jgi:hypothetical protein